MLIQKQNMKKSKTCILINDLSCLILQHDRFVTQLIPAEFILLLIIKTSMKFLYFFIAFLIETHTLLNFTYNFPYQPQDPLSGAFNPFYSPSYSLGTLATSKSLTIKVTLPNKNTQDLSSLVVSLYQQTSASPLTFQQVTLTTVKTNATYLEYSYSIVLSGSTQARFYVRAICNTLTDLNYFYLQVLYYTTGQSSTSSSAKTILKVTETQRNSINRLIYVAAPTNLFFSFFPTLSANSNFDLKVSAINNADWTRANGYRPTSQLAFGNKYNDLLQVQTFRSNTTVTPGFYLVQVRYTPTSGVTSKVNLRMTFQTDVFRCPFSPLFQDARRNFQGCSSKSMSISPKNGKGFPCVSFNEITRECVKCIEGYSLVGNRCQQSTQCLDRQYFHFGRCLDVGPNCGGYDRFTGNCLNCSDPLRYKLENGQCIDYNVICSDRQWKCNNTCTNVSTLCDTFDINTGLCISCINSSKLNADGTCTSVDLACSEGFYISGSNCAPIPVECLIFNPTLAECQVCLVGYFLQDGKCKPISCPKGTVPSRRGSHCVRVSQLCDSYDNTTGDCLTCKEKNHIIKQGRCLQIVSSLAGCRERERLGFGECKQTKEHCHIYNLVTGNCDKCNEKYYLDFTGHCAPANPCLSQNGSNNHCPQVPQNCIAIDRLGLCRKCAKEFILLNGMCANKDCFGNRCLNSNGECVEKSIDINCIVCDEMRSQPTQKNCCPPK